MYSFDKTKAPILYIDMISAIKPFLCPNLLISGAVGYYFNKPLDHMPTPLLKTEEERAQHAEVGVKIINQIVEALDMQNIIETLRQLDVLSSCPLTSRTQMATLFLNQG